MNRPVRLAVAGAVAASLMVTPGVFSSAGSAPPASVTGTIVDRTGSPAAGATVELAIVPPANGKADAPIVPHKFAETTTDADGRFALDGVPPGLLRMQRDGGVELMISGLRGDQGVYHSLTASRSDGDGWGGRRPTAGQSRP